MAKFNRILLKLSGESLMGEQRYGIDEKRLGEYAAQIKEIHDMGVQIGIVIGGGNIFRGLTGAGKGFDRVKGDQMGMLATVINSLALSSALTAIGVKARVLTAIRMEPIGELYTKWKAIDCMEAGEVVILSGGTGNPYFTTDTGSSLRGIEIEADVMLKGTRVDGIYTADPEKDPTATKFSEITYDEIYTRGLKVMDLTATTMCKQNNLPIYVFNMDVVGNLKKVMDGEPIGELYTKWKAIDCMEAGEVVILSGGTGNPYFTTDTGSSLRGIEIEADVMLKGTRVDGIYTADPEKDPTATKFSEITYDEIYTRGLKVMDLTATTMCKQNNLPIYVFNMDVVGNLKKVMEGENIGTYVHN